MTETPTPLHRRRTRYRGTHPRRFDEKYKERSPQLYPETVAKVLASGKTPAGSHRPVLLGEVLEVLAPQPGESGADCTLGYGGHTEELLARLLPGGRLLGLDVDALELPKTEERLRALGFGPATFLSRRSSFAGLAQVLAELEWNPVDVVLADLGVSSMQLDNPVRGFSFKLEGPLDMRMNPNHGQPAAALLEKTQPSELTELLLDNSDEPHARTLGQALGGRMFATTTALTATIRKTLPRLSRLEQDLSVRRVFQALRIAVNDEFSALEGFLRQLPGCLAPGGRVAILTFHSGEDRRVKQAFRAALESGEYCEIAHEVVRPNGAERQGNPRSASAKLRWARKGK